MRRGDFSGPVSGLVLMPDLQAAIILARTRLTDNSPFGDYCPAEVCFSRRCVARIFRFGPDFPHEFGR
jgi:hypothetical protein